MSTTFFRGENPLKADKLNTAFSERVSRGGDTMQGRFNLVGDPVAPLEAATKQYVDRFTSVGVPTGAYIGAAPPGNVLGPLWWDNVSGQLFIQYNDGSSTQWVSANSIDASTLEGSFLPLTGGTVGPTSFTNVTYNMLLSGAAGNGTTDDTAKIQTFLNTLPIGAEVVLPALSQFLIDSADLIVPKGITIIGQGGLEAGANLSGPAFIINPNYRVVVDSGTRLSNFRFLRKSLLASPTTAQANAAAVAWAAEASWRKTSASTASGTTLPFADTSGITVGMRATGQYLGVLNTTVTAVVPNTSVTFSSVTQYPVPQGAYVRFGNSVALDVRTTTSCGGVNLDRLFFLGFNTAIITECGRIYMDTIQADCTTALYAIHGGDAGYVSKFHCAPYYGGDFNVRPGPNYMLSRADGWVFEQCSVIGWRTGWVLADNVGGITLQRCWAETVPGNGTTTGFRTEGGITNEVTLNCCVSTGVVAYDFQHTAGLVNALGCTSAGSTDPSPVAHYRFGAGSSGAVLQPVIVAGAQMPFVVSPGVGQWQIVAPCIYGSPATWISGAVGDLYLVSVIGGPMNGATVIRAQINQQVLIDSPTRTTAPVTLPISGAFPAYGFRNTTSGASFGMFAYSDTEIGFGPTASSGLGTSVVARINTSGDITATGGLKLGTVNSDPASAAGGVEMYPGFGGFGVTASTLNYNFNGNHQFRAGATAILTMGSPGGLVMQSPLKTLTVGFNNTAPIAKPTVTGSKGANAALASLLTALASYGLVTDSST